MRLKFRRLTADIEKGIWTKWQLCVETCGTKDRDLVAQTYMRVLIGMCPQEIQAFEMTGDASVLVQYLRGRSYKNECRREFWELLNEAIPNFKLTPDEIAYLYKHGKHKAITEFINMLTLEVTASEALKQLQPFM